MPPNTHCPSTLCPQWYFLLPTLLLSIWTVFPSPPIFSLFCSIVTLHVSLQKLSQSTAVLGLIFSCRQICHWSRSWHHQYVCLSTSSSVKLLSSNQLPFHMLDVCLWRFPPACFRHSHLFPSKRSLHSTSDISLPHLMQFCFEVISFSFINHFMVNSFVIKTSLSIFWVLIGYYTHAKELLPVMHHVCQRTSINTQTVVQRQKYKLFLVLYIHCQAKQAKRATK